MHYEKCAPHERWLAASLGVMAVAALFNGLMNARQPSIVYQYLWLCMGLHVGVIAGARAAETLFMKHIKQRDTALTEALTTSRNLLVLCYQLRAYIAAHQITDGEEWKRGTDGTP